MEFRQRSIVRAGRWVSMAESRLPAVFRHEITRELEDALGRRPGKAEFMRFADRFQAKLYAALLLAYDDEPFCRLLALKLCNLAVGRYHFRNRHSNLMSRPFQLMVDPTNACQLACPGCVHTSNRAFAAHFEWPKSTMPLDVFARFLEQSGPFATCIYLYNYGEPLLHKRFADFVRLSKRYLLFTLASTNLSMPLNDTDELVDSGLDRLVLSIDGTTQDVYRAYRRKGHLELVFDNVRRIVESKRRLGSKTPYLVWQFLTFEHNTHQMNDARRMALELGVNEILFATPFDVANDAPEIRSVRAPGRGRHVLQPWDGRWCDTARRSAVEEGRTTIDAAFHRSWEQRFRDAGEKEEQSREGAPTCAWLYHNITMDGAARLMPCCMAPDDRDRRVVFSNFTGAEIVNTPMAERARLAFADRPEYEKTTANLQPRDLPYCAQCEELPMPYGLANVAADVRAMDEKRAIPRSLTWSLTHWT